jgi:hypothetical protein
VKILQTISSNTGNTLERTINNHYRLYTAFKNDTILVNFGDSTSQILQINSGNL